MFTLFWAPRSAFDCALAARGAQLGFCSPIDVEPSVSPPPVGNNSIRMARSDTSHDGHHQGLFNHCCPESMSRTTRPTGITVMVKYSLTHKESAVYETLQACRVNRNVLFWSFGFSFKAQNERNRTFAIDSGILSGC